jgi:hypothetical protein
MVLGQRHPEPDKRHQILDFTTGNTDLLNFYPFGSIDDGALFLIWIYKDTRTRPLFVGSLVAIYTCICSID